MSIFAGAPKFWVPNRRSRNNIVSLTILKLDRSGLVAKECFSTKNGKSSKEQISESYHTKKDSGLNTGRVDKELWDSPSVELEDTGCNPRYANNTPRQTRAE